MAALLGAAVMNELGVGPLRPAPRRLILLPRKDGHRHRDLDALDVEEAALVLPIKTGRGDRGVRQPVERDVVADIVARQLCRGARGAAQSSNDAGGGLTVTVIVIQ